MGKLTLKQFITALENEVRSGKAYLAITKALLRVEPLVFGTAPTFFGLTAEGGVLLAQMTVARLYDEAANTVKVNAFLEQAKREIAQFQKGDRRDVRKAIGDSMREVHKLRRVLGSIKHRRNEWLAHLDQETVRNPQALGAKAALTIEDLDLVFEKTENIIRELARLLDGTIGPIGFIGEDDYNQLFNLIRSARAAERKDFDRAFESQFGHPPPPVTKPWEID